jgi:nucleoside-diphosphate-sugar epimerase
MSSPRILVTGGTGFIGRYVAERLRAKGLEPIITTAPAQPTEGAHSLDLRDEKATRSVVTTAKPDIVVHLAGVTGATMDSALCNAVNYIGTVNLLNALERNGISRVILLGTAAEYGPQQTPFGEDMPLMPGSAYARSKARANEYALDMHAKSGFPVTVLRVFTAYGHGQPEKMFLSQLIGHAVSQQSFEMSDGTQKRDFVFAGDVADAILMASEAPGALGHTINIAGGRGIALKDIARKVWDACGADPILLKVGALDKSSDDAFDTEADISQAAQLLRWTPATPFIGDAAPGHPLYKMIERARAGFEGDGSVVSTGRSAQ